MVAKNLFFVILFFILSFAPSSVVSAMGMGVVPSSMVFTSFDEVRTLQVVNPNAFAVEFDVSADGLDIEPSEGVIAPGERIKLAVIPTSLVYGSGSLIHIETSPVGSGEGEIGILPSIDVKISMAAGGSDLLLADAMPADDVKAASGDIVETEEILPDSPKGLQVLTDDSKGDDLSAEPQSKLKSPLVLDDDPLFRKGELVLIIILSLAVIAVALKPSLVRHAPRNEKSDKKQKKLPKKRKTKIKMRR